MNGIEIVELALSIAALVLVLVELFRQGRDLIAWAVLLLAIVEILNRL